MNIIKIWTLAYLDKPVKINGSMRVRGPPIRSPRVKRKGVPIMQIADAYFFSFAWNVVYRYADWFSLSWYRIRLNGNTLVTHLDQGREKNSFKSFCCPWLVATEYLWFLAVSKSMAAF